MNDNKVAVAVVGDFKFLYKHFNNFYTNLRINGNYKGDVIILTNHLNPTFFITFLKNYKHIHILRFRKIKFSRSTCNKYLSLDTNNQPNRFKYKNFQWFKLNLFHQKLKKWQKILYLDINLTIHEDINDFISIDVKNKFLAKADGYPEYKRNLSSQFDMNKPESASLSKNFDLNDNRYFQTGLLFYDTNIIESNTIKDILKIANQYPLSITNEQGILNLYFQKRKNIYKELPEYLNEEIIYYYWMLPNQKIKITKQLVEQYK